MEKKMLNRIVCLLFVLSLICVGVTSLSGCAGGSRGTGIRFNSGTKSSPLDDDDDDDDKPVHFHRR